MVLFEFSIFLQLFGIISISVNTVQAGVTEEYDECLRQISFAFGNDDSSTGCFRYAAEHYVKGQDIPNKKKDTPTKKTHIENKKEDIPSGSQRPSKPQISVNSFKDLMSSERPTGNKRKYSQDTTKIQADKHGNVSTEPNDDLNYAEMYYLELEKMIYGRNASNAPQFCRKYFSENLKECTEALWKFGTSQQQAVYTALTAYRLSDCRDNPFIFSYMQFIVSKYRIRSPSRSPKEFCRNLIFHKH